MLPFPASTLRSSRSPVTFVGSVAVPGSTIPAPSSIGAQAGDIAVLINNSFPSILTSNGWALAYNIGWKKLATADLGATISTGISGWTLAIYRGASSVVSISNTNLSAGTSSVAGYTPDAKHMGTMLVAFGANVTTTVNSPAMAQRTALAVTGETHGLFDRLSPQNSIYAGQNFSVTVSGSNNITVYEFRSA